MIRTLKCLASQTSRLRMEFKQEIHPQGPTKSALQINSFGVIQMKTNTRKIKFALTGEIVANESSR